MMSELVDGSAWIWPPVVGWLAVLLDAPAVAPAAPVGLAVVAELVLLRVSADSAARKVAASLVASAFFR